MSSTADKPKNGINLKQKGRNHPQYKHGDCGNSQRARIYQTWASMKNRCLNPHVPDYKYYGGQGIEVCLEWISDYRNFKNWALANGYQDDLTIDRINPRDGYNPSNCQFLTRTENVKKQWEQLKATKRIEEK